MKTPDRIVEFKHQYGPYEYGSTFAVGEEIAAQLPKLALPTMNDAGREAFRALLAYETRTGSDMFKLLEARGVTAHPCDYVPEFRWQYSGHNPKIYQPWADWLSENEITRFHQGNTLTIENCYRFPASQRLRAFRDLVRTYDPAKLEYAIAILKSQPASVRAKLLNEVDAGGSFYGIYPWQVPFITEFLEDKAASVRKVAKDLLARGGGWLSEKEYCQRIARHLAVTEDKVFQATENDNPHGFLYREYCCATFDGLARELGITPRQLAECADFESLGPNFEIMAALSADSALRNMIARRKLDAGKGAESIASRQFEDSDDALWSRGYEATKLSPYINSLEDYPGFTLGTIGVDELLDWREFEFMRASVKRELETSELPVNIQYDPLRYLGKFVDKEAAQCIIDEAISLGMRPDHPRLTMLRLNCAL